MCLSGWGWGRGKLVGIHPVLWVGGNLTIQLPPMKLTLGLDIDTFLFLNVTPNMCIEQESALTLESLQKY